MTAAIVDVASEPQEQQPVVTMRPHNRGSKTFVTLFLSDVKLSWNLTGSCWQRLRLIHSSFWFHSSLILLSTTSLSISLYFCTSSPSFHRFDALVMYDNFLAPANPWLDTTRSPVWSTLIYVICVYCWIIRPNLAGSAGGISPTLSGWMRRRCCRQRETRTAPSSSETVRAREENSHSQVRRQRNDSFI